VVIDEAAAAGNAIGVAGADKVIRIAEIFLRDGQMVEQWVDRELADEIVGSRAFIWRDGMTDEDKRTAAIFTILLERMSKGTGFLTLTDPSRRTWAIPADMIKYVNVREVNVDDLAPTDQQRPRIGFQPPQQPLTVIEEDQVPFK
jgi:hypothetical protein